MCIYYYINIIFFCLKFKSKHGWPRCSRISITLALRSCTIWVLSIWNVVMLDWTWKTCFLLTMINQGSKVTSEKVSVLFCSAWSLLPYCKDKGVTLSWSSNSKTPRIFGPLLLKNIKISNAHNFGNTGPISKIPTLLRLEAWDLCPYKISWILVRVRWKIPILLDHLTWNDPCSSVLIIL